MMTLIHYFLNQVANCRLDLFSLTSNQPASKKGHVDSYLSPKFSSLEKKMRQSMIQGNYANGKELIGTVLNKIEREVDKCVIFQGFSMFYSIGLAVAQAQAWNSVT